MPSLIVPVAVTLSVLHCSWVCPKVCERYGIAGSSNEAWEANGGGTWTRK